MLTAVVADRSGHVASRRTISGRNGQARLARLKDPRHPRRRQRDGQDPQAPCRPAHPCPGHRRQRCRRRHGVRVLRRRGQAHALRLRRPLGAQAAWLARVGLTGPPTIIEGRRGLFRLFADQALVIDDALWGHFHIVDTVFRLYPNPTIGFAATIVECLAALTRDHPGIDWRDITRIRVGLPSIAVGHGAITTHPSDAVSAQFSTAFGIALILVHGSAAPADYASLALRADPDISTVTDKVEPFPCDFGADAPLLSAHLEIQLNDGSTLTRLQHGSRGHPGTPGLGDTVREKFRANLRGLSAAPAAEAVTFVVSALEDEPDLTRLISLLVPQEPEAPPAPATSREDSRP